MDNQDKAPLLRIPKASYTNKNLRLRTEVCEEIQSIADDKDRSFNSIVEILIDYALKYYDKDYTQPKTDKRKKSRPRKKAVDSETL